MNNAVIMYGIKINKRNFPAIILTIWPKFIQGSPVFKIAVAFNSELLIHLPPIQFPKHNTDPEIKTTFADHLWCL